MLNWVGMFCDCGYKAFYVLYNHVPPGVYEGHVIDLNLRVPNLIVSIMN